METGRFEFAALPADIEVLNRRAVEVGDLDITAMSVRRWADVQERYAITACGASFGDGYGPKVVARASDARVLCGHCLDKPGLVIAIPGRGTTAFLMLNLLLREVGVEAEGAGRDAGHADPHRLQSSAQGAGASFIELPFDQIAAAVAQGDADAGVVIHEAQLSFAEAGLCMVADVGAWWKQKTGLKLPLGVNAVNRGLEKRYGRGTLGEVGAILQRSVAYAMEHWDESVRYAQTFAEANTRRVAGTAAAAAALERVDRYCRMYVTEETLDMGEGGREAIRRLLAEGSAARLCPAVGAIEVY
jgi:1,4-dihydroxy-6-naphthoate synthase